MYRIMLADDEKIVLDSLGMIIQRNFPEQCQIETARTGRDVIELAESFRPDIAFMDIQMPGINGIDAIREIKKESPLTEFIVLTAYDRFDYAKDAVALGVLEYMNKPFRSDDIVRVLSKAMKSVDSRRQQRSDNLKIRERMEAVTPIIESGFLYSVMFQDDLDEDLDNYRQLLGLSTDGGCMMALVVGDEQHGSHMTNAVGAGVRTQRSYPKVREAIKETWSNALVGNVLSNKLPVYLPMAAMDYEERIRLINTAHELVRRLRRMTDVSFRIGIGSVHPLREGKDSYEEALRALNNSTGSVAHVEDLPLQCIYDEEYPIQLERDLFSAFRQSDLQGCERYASQYCDWMLENYSEQDHSVRLKILEFVLYAEYLAYSSGGMVYHFSDRENYLDLVMNAERNSDLREFFIGHITEACRNLTTKKDEHENQLVARAQEYIRNNYHKDLSLDEVSRQLNLSPYYFSKLFKEETGSNFVEYVTNLRIERAKELLATQDGSSMKEICSAVGYSDPNYFSRIFKKSVGVTPTEYREKGHA